MHTDRSDPVIAGVDHKVEQGTSPMKHTYALTCFKFLEKGIVAPP